MLHKIVNFLIYFYFQRRVKWYNKHINGEITLVRQGWRGRDRRTLKKLKVGVGGNLKSGTYLECKEIEIGVFVHCT